MPGQRLGYVRVSSVGQHPDRQLDGLALDRLFTDHASGKDTQRPQLAALLQFARDGDTVVVHRRDRLARNRDDLRRLAHGLTQRGVRVEFLKEGLTFTGDDAPMARLLLSVLGAFAEFERALLRERQREGIALCLRGRPASAAASAQRAGTPPTAGTVRARYSPASLTRWTGGPHGCPTAPGTGHPARHAAPPAADAQPLAPLAHLLLHRAPDRAVCATGGRGAHTECAWRRGGRGWRRGAGCVPRGARRARGTHRMPMAAVPA